MLRLSNEKARAILAFNRGWTHVDSSKASIDQEEPPSQVKTVAASILGEFFDALAQEDLSDVVSRLRKTVLEDGVFAEPSIRAALFPDAP